MKHDINMNKELHSMAGKQEQLREAAGPCSHPPGGAHTCLEDQVCACGLFCDLSKSFLLSGLFFIIEVRVFVLAGTSLAKDRDGYMSHAETGSSPLLLWSLPGTKMALKFVNKSKTKLKNFLREVSITNSLSSSPFIIKIFDVVFETEDCYVFAQEYAPAGDLFDIIPPQVFGTGA